MVTENEKSNKPNNNQEIKLEQPIITINKVIYEKAPLDILDDDQ